MQLREETSGNGRSAATARETSDFFDSPSNGRSARERDGRASRAAALGWFSVGLGVAELVAPRALGRLIGAPTHARARRTMRWFGLREVASGLLILSQKNPAPWLWGRVAGDLIDLATLGNASRSRGANSARLLAATAATVGVTLLDTMASLETSREASEDELEQGVTITKSLTIRKPVEEVYAFFRDFRNHARFMSHVSAVEVTGSRSRWHVRGPGGVEVSWESELTGERPQEALSWRALPNAPVPNDGSVTFFKAPGDRGTEIHVQLRYEPPLGTAGLTLARLFRGVPGVKLENDLRRLKQILETGEVVHSAASIHQGPHPARPSVQSEPAEFQRTVSGTERVSP